VSPQRRLTEADLPGYLASVGILPQGAAAAVEPVGDGNINWVRRVRAGADSWVVKQARPALERFPEYCVSSERIVFEARFYETAAPLDRMGVCPRVLHFDPRERVLVLEDLGDAERLDAALERAADVTPVARTLAAFLADLHRATTAAGLAARFANHEMRGLHGDHIFVLPFRENDFPLSPALRERASELRGDAALLASIDAAHARYLEPVGALVHGDVQPANVLLPASGPRLIDAEIAHVGDPAFDLGQLVGHLLLPAAARGRAAAARPAVDAAWSVWAQATGQGPAARRAVARYAGIELLRRTLGAARVPAVASDAASLRVVDAGLRLIREGLD
jgi:5-methylthioribose kinase